ncbi:MAG: shikimate dehydrogenase [Alphaproteobacteria bacterium]|nr:shikimate dehydrogenase [Alphaproteobacteria bacterium]
MRITAKARVAGVMGWPVAHSLSPRLYNYWLERYGIDGAFIPLPVSPDHFAQTLRVLSQAGFVGVNITVPHKEAALEAVDIADHAARRIGAVNMVTFGGDGSMRGTNTDGVGFLAHLRAEQPDFELEAGPAMIVGAGGAARALAVALIDAGVPELCICNRTLSRAEALAVGLAKDVRVINWVDRARALEGVNLLVNTTTQGMVGEEPLDINLRALSPGAVVYDIVYNPLETPLMKAASAKGNPVIGGLGMLLHQAAPCFKAWFGIDPEVNPELAVFVGEGLS